ncbi:Peroxiredoxin [Thermoleophilum album]|uniref:Peroxiredoxin n=1 Tax=Thermoleophilum album TaxID=29539 RepID=A0A1H6FI15_THEAL|nr:Peroxiredoxin [Thermoleophilum album]
MRVVSALERLLGVAREPQRTNPPARGDELGELVLPDHEGREVRLGELWAERPAVLVWLRHYGCVHCRAHALELDQRRGEFEEAGVGLWLIGQATPRHAAHFRRKLGIELPVLADRERESYRRAGAKVATFGELLGPRSLSAGTQRMLSSFGRVRQGRVVGHPAQLGGALVIDRDGRVMHAHMAEDAADNANADELLAAARRLAAGANARSG